MLKHFRRATRAKRAASRRRGADSAVIDSLLGSAAMQIQVNGEPREVAPGTTVRALLESLGLGETLVAVERNQEIVPRAEHASTEVGDGDRLEIVHFVGGG